MRGITTLLPFLLATFLSAAPATAQAPQQAQALVEQTTRQVLTRLDEQKEALQADPEGIYLLVEDLVLPHFDFERMSRWVLGRYWRQADESQQQRFVELFRDLLVRTYARALLEYSDQEVRFEPLRPGADARTVSVRSRIQQAGGYSINLDYALFTDGETWKVYDISVNGVSLVTNYRAAFATEIRRGGMEGLLMHLESLVRRARENDG